MKQYQRDFHAVLGVSEQAGPDELKRAYQALAANYHPRRFLGDAYAREGFNNFSLAYLVLSTPEIRGRYLYEKRLRSQESDRDRHWGLERKAGQDAAFQDAARFNEFLADFLASNRGRDILCALEKEMAQADLKFNTEDFTAWASRHLRPHLDPAWKKPVWPRVVGIIAIILGFSFLLAYWPKTTAPLPGKAAIPSEPMENLSPQGDAGTKNITFSNGSQRYYFRNNAKAGRLFILTGMVRNGYPKPRSFIRLRGQLWTGQDESLADCFVYAGNVVSEEELKTLPMDEIRARLNVKSGQNGLNTNIRPGQEIPFMVVFDNFPAGAEQYRIDPESSSPAD